MADLTGMLMAAAGNAAPAGYQISRSLRFNSADSAYLNRTPASAGNRKTWTWSAWVKRSGLSAAQRFFGNYDASGANGSAIEFNSSNQIRILDYTASLQYELVTTPVYRDVSAWYHIVVALDTTQATSSNRLKLYVNGVQVTAFGTATYPTLNFDGQLNTATAHGIGRAGAYNADYFPGYMTEIHFIDGQALTPSNFGVTDATTGVWKPKAYTGTYGTNGFYLNFSDNTSTTTLGEDQAGSNDWTLNNFSVAAGAGNDSLVDTPTPYGDDTGAGGEVRGNYCTLNPLDKGSDITLSNGNLSYSQGNTVNDTARSTIGMVSGKWYCEVTIGAANKSTVGIAKQAATLDSYLGSDANGWGYYSDNGTKNNNGVSTAYGATFTGGDVIGIALDVDAGNLVFYKNGVSQGTAFTGLTSGPYFFAYGSNESDGSFNFGQRPFAYTAPSGFKALCTQNLPTPTVVQGDDYFNTVLYTGTGSSQSITGVGFQPDWVWIKERSGAADHGLYDAVRGVQNQLESNTTTAETAEATGLTAFGSDGFTVGSLAQLNTNTDTYVAWNWNAGGSNATNTDGTITSTVRANPTAGVSIVSYTGTGSAATVGHGLGAAPAMIIVKNRDQADAWQVYHKANTAAPETDYLVLNTTAATADAADRWNDTAPTSTVFSIGNGVEVNTNTEDYIAYCFAEVEGFSKFGSYTANASADGPFVYCGFRPAFVMFKRYDNAGAPWSMFDSKRNSYNAVTSEVDANASTAEYAAGNGLDFLSNGFKLRDSAYLNSVSGNNFIFMAFAESPFKYSLAR